MGRGQGSGHHGAKASLGRLGGVEWTDDVHARLLSHRGALDRRLGQEAGQRKAGSLRGTRPSTACVTTLIFRYRVWDEPASRARVGQ